MVYTRNLTESSEYKECIKLLGFLSKEELLSKLEAILKILGDSQDSVIKRIKTDLNIFIKAIEEASLEAPKASSEIVSANEKLSRVQLKEVCVIFNFSKV